MVLLRVKQIEVDIYPGRSDLILDSQVNEYVIISCSVPHASGIPRDVLTGVELRECGRGKHPVPEQDRLQQQGIRTHSAGWLVSSNTLRKTPAQRCVGVR